MKNLLVILTSVFSVYSYALDFSPFAGVQEYEFKNAGEAETTMMGAGLDVKLNDYVSLVGFYGEQESNDAGTSGAEVDLDSVTTASVRVGKTTESGVFLYAAPTYVVFSKDGSDKDTMGWSVGVTSNVGGAYVGLEYSDYSGDIKSLSMNVGLTF